MVTGGIGAIEPQPARPRRLGLVLDQIVCRHEGRYSTDEVVIRFVEEVAERAFERIQFCSRVRDADHTAPYPLEPSRFEIVPLPWYSSVPELCLKSPMLLPRIARILSAAMPGWGLTIAGGIHPVTPLALRMARRRAIPALLWIRGDLMTDLRYRLSGVRRAAGTSVARFMLRAIPSGTPVLSIGRDDYPFLSRMGPVHLAYSSKFGENDFVPLPRPVRPAGEAPRLLYVGRLAPEKGLEVLMEAMERLCSGGGARSDPGAGSDRGGARVGAGAGSSAEATAAGPRLTLVGWDYFGSTYGDDFRRRLERSRLAPLVRLTGHVPYGPRLFEIYDEHDVLVLPSFTEGFPQVILEAMVRGVPVVATRVGGVPRIVRDGENGLLVPPGDPEALASAVQRVLGDPDFAAGLAAAGARSARPYTKEVQAESILRFVDRCFPGSGFAAGELPDPGVVATESRA